MASTSSSPPTTTKYDVFLSFNGQDTRHTFTDHLYHALISSGIKTYRNEHDSITKNEIETVIKSSKASIIVLSENYANSSSCLDELAMIMERRRRFFHLVIPVYYHVEVGNLKNNEFDVKNVDKKVEKWKEALNEVSDLSGMVVSGPETKFIADIVNTVSNKLRLKLVSTPPHLTGMDIRAEDINSWVKDVRDSEVLAICGMGGSGKTTLAKFIYDSNSPKFESSSFLEDIGKICEKPYGLCTLQEQLLVEILEDKKKELDVTWYKVQIEKVLKNKKVLIVLDDIDTKEQIEALLGMEKIKTESKIIITSRLSVATIQLWLGSAYRRCKEHKLELLNEHESLELLSWYAFGSNIPTEGFKELALKAAQYCTGNPLALKLLGSLFVSAKDSRKRSNIEYWMSILKVLEGDPDYRMQSILQMSFDRLPFYTYRELFLHIACFFVGEDEDYVVKILEPDYCATAGIVTLINKCLLTVSPSKKLMMHGLIIEMARRIVVEESPTNPGNRSRVWCNEESYTLLRQGEGSDTIEGLALDMRMVREEMHDMPTAFDVDSLVRMDSLKLLQLNYVKLSGSYDDFPEDLRWLCWHGFHLENLPELFMGNLVAIDMSYSKLKLFEPPMVGIRVFSLSLMSWSFNLLLLLTQVIRQLKILNFKDSHSLAEIHHISRLPNLETLILWNCYSLVHVSETIGELKRLALLNLIGCEQLLKASNFSGQSPQQPLFSFPHSLERLLLKSCNLEHNNYYSTFQDQSLLQHLNLANNKFELLPDYNHLKNLRVLDLSFCSKLKCILRLPSTLEKLFITCCKSLEKVTFLSHRFTLGEIDYEGCTNLLEIEGLIKLVPISKIDEIDLGHMKWIKQYQNHEVCLIGDCQLTVDRSRQIQMLYEFGILSTYLPDIMDLDIPYDYTSQSSSLSFNVPPHYNNNLLKGLNVTFKYALSSNEKQIFPIFTKVSNTTKGCDWIYNPMVFGKPGVGEIAIWLSYWSMEKLLDVGDKVTVSIIVENGLTVIECGVSLVYEEEEKDTWRSNTEWDMSSFKLSADIYYLCRRDFLKSMDVDGPIPSWFQDLFGYKIDYTGNLFIVKADFWYFKRYKDGEEPVDLKRCTHIFRCGNFYWDNPLFIMQTKTFHYFIFTDIISIVIISSSNMAVLGANGCNYDVFLSFRGEDTHNSFTDHLYDALKRAGISTFRDNDINRGEELKPEIERAIKESKASIVVLSENYATSSWCLDELLLILKQRKEPETSFIKEIVDTIYNKVGYKDVYLPPNITGMATNYEEINFWLKESNLEIIAICGMGGSGKTTLAKYIYDTNWRSFENASFVEDIGSRCKGPNDLLNLQEQLLKDILGGKKRKIPGISRGRSKLEKALETKKSLIVLDDIVEHSQLVTLLGTRKINAESKIIITTRENTNNWFKSTSWSWQDYRIKLLNDDESLELLSRHAFGCKSPIEGFQELAVRAVRYCEGNPPALVVLGSSLSNSNTILYWTSQLNLLETDFDSRIQSVLVTSYNSLPFDSEKQLFLHIACFFVGLHMDYVVKILEHDYSAISGINTLCNRCLLSISPNKKLMMHRLLQEMGKNIVRQESLKSPSKRSRVWLSSDSYKILSIGEGSETMEGLALDMQMLRKERFAFKSSNLKTDALKKKDNLKLLQLNFVELDGSYENFSVDLRWLCWFGLHLKTIPSGLFMGNMVAIDLSYSKLEVFDPPMVLQSLQILNLKDSHNLVEIRYLSWIPNLETFVLWNCDSLARVCGTIQGLTKLSLLNMTGCKNLCDNEKIKLLEAPQASTSGRRTAEHPTFSFPHSLQRLFLKDCNLESTDSFPLSFSAQPSLQYLNLVNSLFEFLPCYDHLKNLRVLDLSLCTRLKLLLCLPSTLAELYVYNSKLDEIALGHMRWLKEYQNCEVTVVGDDELTIGRSLLGLQMLYEFDIMSTSLPDIKDPNITPDYISESSYLSFDMPSCPKNKRFKGLDLTFRYIISGDDGAWFAKISTTNGVDLLYNPKVFGEPEPGKAGIWLSYWPIGNMLDTGDKVNVSIIVMSGLEVHECGASLVHTDDEVENVETLGGDLSQFQLSTGAYYLCRRDFFELMEVGRLTRGWFNILVGDNVDDTVTELRGWRKTGRPTQLNPSFIELKTVRCIIHGPESEDIYKIGERSKLSYVNKTSRFISSMVMETVKSVTPVLSYLKTKVPSDDLNSNRLVLKVWALRSTGTMCAK
ncbi:NB-ARC domains-containing protein [Artemisia annua]|uniref:NB-ARC domains-containing protein n=1 Tax=Artemisia annua TaxID=35608 RepID=A0A2U1PBK6_ARTAN|nr:NB-ARC domains-containing protein [Artemisia annua]